MNKILYRYEIEYSSYDGGTAIHLREFPVIKETDKCYFIKRYFWGGERRVLKDAYNTFAFDNRADAKDHFVRRTTKRIAWFKYWIEECEKALELIKAIK